MENEEKKYISQYFISGLPIINFGVVMLRAVDGTCFTNVPLSVIEHSPTGFSWGYAGSGPADLALNILEYAVSVLNLARMTPIPIYSGKCSREAFRYHQSFKELFIADVPERGGVIPWRQIRNWLEASIDKVPMQVPPMEPRTVTLAYPKEFLNDFIKAHPGADLALSKTAFMSMLEDSVLLFDADANFVAAPYTMKHYDGSFMVNDSWDGKDPGELSQMIRDRIFELSSTPESWLIKRGFINEQG